MRFILELILELICCPRRGVLGSLRSFLDGGLMNLHFITAARDSSIGPMIHPNSSLISIPYVGNVF